VIIITDHNIHVSGFEGYYDRSAKRVLVLTGEEVHNQDRFPQKNHLLALGAEAEVATFADDPQKLIDAVRQRGGLSFLAHPDEMDLKLVHEDNITWVNWEVNGYTGFELWNQFSELKSVSRTPLKLVRNVFFPEYIATGPEKATLERWDSLLAGGRHLPVIAGADAHSLKYKFGPIRKTIFPYIFHFSAVNNHLLLPKPLSGDLIEDKRMIYQALGKGSSFIGNDLPASTRNFSFTISNEETTATMGDTLIIKQSSTAQISLPIPAEIRLIKNGNEIFRSTNKDHLAYPLVEPGAYRVECFLNYLSKRRGWIFSNPIYVVKGNEPNGNHQ
jgi:hypothetical protein